MSRERTFRSCSGWASSPFVIKLQGPSSGALPAFPTCGGLGCIRYARFPATRLYAVEISGWDSMEYFFVEKCELEWNEESGKQVALKRAEQQQHPAGAAVATRRFRSFASCRLRSRAGWKNKEWTASIPAQHGGSSPKRSELSSLAREGSEGVYVEWHARWDPRSSAPKRHDNPK